MTGLSIVVRILQVGFSGFAFLMAYLGYRLMHSEISRKAARPQIFESVRWYMKWTFGLAIIVGAMSLGEYAMRFITTMPAAIAEAHRRELLDCENQLNVLQALSEDSKATVASMQSAIIGYSRACMPLLQELAK